MSSQKLKKRNPSECFRHLPVSFAATLVKCNSWRFVIVAFPDHTHLLILSMVCRRNLQHCSVFSDDWGGALWDNRIQYGIS